MGEQLDLPTHDDTALFMTDEQLDERLRQLENGLADFEARVPAMRREVTVLRRWLVRDQVRQAQAPGETRALQGSESGNGCSGLVGG